MPLNRNLSAAALLLAASLLAGTDGNAQEAAPPPAAPAPPAGTGSGSFCLFEVPPVNERRHWVNLAHVQYIELRSDELRLYYGGGNFGSGHEARIPVRGRDDANAQLKRINDAARACR